MFTVELQDIKDHNPCLPGIRRAEAILNYDEKYSLADALTLGVNPIDLTWLAFQKLSPEVLKSTSFKIFGVECSTCDQLEHALSLKVKDLRVRQDRFREASRLCKEFLETL